MLAGAIRLAKSARRLVRQAREDGAAQEVALRLDVILHIGKNPSIS